MKNIIAMGKTFFLCLALTSLTFTVFAAPQATSARKQIYQQAVASAAADIDRVAKLKNWQGQQSKINVFIPAEVSHFSHCQQPLSVALPITERIDLTRLRYDIRCEGANGWEVNVTVKPDIYLPVLVAKQKLVRGTVLAASDLEVKKKNISSMRDAVITVPDDAIGLTVKKTIRAMQPISPSLLEQPILVERGQRVVMLAEQDGVQAKMIGEAQKKGRKGEVIKVKNLSSQRTVSAMVAGSGLVKMLLVPGE